MQNQDLQDSANGEMGEIREENENLKLLLTRLVKDYQSLQTHFFDILQQDNNKQEDQAASKPTAGTSDHSHEQHEDENELVSLSLGLKMKDDSNEDIEKKNNSNSSEGNNDKDLDEGDLALGLGITSVDSLVSAKSNSFEEETGKEVEEPTEIWPPSKAMKTMRSNWDNKGETASQQSQMKKARVSIRARCDNQMMNDGCKWRKYGQKTAKGNPCPRAYYRCTVSQSCPVRKQVQRCAEDMSILIATYEGTHDHPLPLSATAMASTTSAAASILKYPSLTSQPLLKNPETSPVVNLTSSNNHNALNFSNYQIPRPPHQFYFPNPSISTSNSHPTITIDLTSPTLPNTSYIGFTSGFSSTPGYNSSTSLNFFSSSTFSPLQSSISHSPYWSSSSTYGGYNYFNNNGTPGHNKIQTGTILDTGKQPLPGNFHQPNFMSNLATSQRPFPESVAAATKAITADPKFRSALAAALTTYVGNGIVGGSGSNGIGSASTGYMNVPSSAPVGDQQGSLALFPAPLPAAASKSTSGSSFDKSNQLLD